MAIELDLMEYSSDALAQAAYVTNASEAVLGSQLNGDTPIMRFGNHSGIHKEAAHKITLTTSTFITAVEIKQGNASEGSPTGGWILRIETDNAGVRSGTLANANATIVVSPPGANTIIKGSFATPFTLAAGTYHIVALCGTQTDNNYWYLTVNANASGVCQQIFDNIPEIILYDMYYKLYGLPLQSYSEATIKQQGSYSLEVIAAITDSLNKTLTRTVSPTIDLSNINTIKYWVYALRTGSNFKVSFHDSGGYLIEHTPNILVSNEWQQETVDISAVSNANKDVIDQIKFTILNADAANIFYLDGMFSPENFIKTFTETLTLSEPSMAKAISRPFLETLTLSEPSFVKGITKIFTETITLSETFGRAISKLLKDTVTLTEVAARDIAIFFQETITLTDNIAKGITRTLSDSLSLTDVFTKVLKWLHISHIATTWNKVTKTLTNWTKTNRTNTPWHKKYE